MEVFLNYYESTSRLESIVYPDNTTTTFHYDNLNDSNNLTAIKEMTSQELLLAGGNADCFGREVGDYFGVDYSTVSVSPKRLREKVAKGSSLRN